MNAIDVATLAVVISYGLLVLCTAGVLLAAFRPPTRRRGSYVMPAVELPADFQPPSAALRGKP